MKIGTTPSPEKYCHLSIATHHEDLKLLLLAAHDAFEYLALQLETSTGSQFIKHAIQDYHNKAKQAKYFVNLITKGDAS